MAFYYDILPLIICSIGITHPDEYGTVVYPRSLAPPQHVTKTLEPENKGGYLLLPRIQLAVHIHLRVNFTLNSLFKTLQKQVGCFNHRLVTMVVDNLWL